MPVTLYYLSGSPYAWRVWLALAHKDVAVTLKTMSYDAGDFRAPEFAALNPRRRVPVLLDDDFVLYESAAVVEYVEERWGEPRLFSANLRERARERRLVREADQYVAEGLERLVEAVLFTAPEERDPTHITAICADLRTELAAWEMQLAGDYLGQALCAADFTLFPLLALLGRMASRNPGLIPADLVGPRVSGWMRRMEALPVVQQTWPPHWK